MKHLKTLLSSACCLSICLTAFSSFGATGSEAAEWITSDPTAYGYEFPGDPTISCIGYDKVKKAEVYNAISVTRETTWEDMKEWADCIGSTLSTVAQNVLASLTKIAYLEQDEEWSSLRIDVLEQSTAEAFESLDEIDIEDLSSKVTARLTKSSKTGGGAHYTGYNIFNVSGAQADGKSIASNSQDKLEVKGFSNLSTKLMQIPHKGTDTIAWAEVGYWGDGESIGDKDSGGNYISFIKIAGWDNPGAAPHHCDESIAAMLKRMESDPAPTPEQDPNNHLVLTRYSGGTNTVMHFTPIGSLGAVGGGSAIHFFGTVGDAVVGSGSTTNNVVFDSFDDSNVEILVESDNYGNATITFGVYYQ